MTRGSGSSDGPSAFIRRVDPPSSSRLIGIRTMADGSVVPLGPCPGPVAQRLPVRHTEKLKPLFLLTQSRGGTMGPLWATGFTAPPDGNPPLTLLCAKYLLAVTHYPTSPYARRRKISGLFLNKLLDKIVQDSIMRIVCSPQTAGCGRSGGHGPGLVPAGRDFAAAKAVGVS